MARSFTYQCAFESLVWPFSIFAKQSSNPMHCAPFALSASAIIVNVLVDQFVTSSSQGCASFFKGKIVFTILGLLMRNFVNLS